MPAPKGHAPYPGCEKGGEYGFRGKGENFYSDELLHELGKGLVKWIKEKNNIWCHYYFAIIGINKNTIRRLRERSEFFNNYFEQAKEIQESKLLTDPYFKRCDGYHARWMLARHHKGEWEDKPIVIKEGEEDSLKKSMDLVNYLQDKAPKE
jgi:hypothetical protein